MENNELLIMKQAPTDNSTCVPNTEKAKKEVIKAEDKAIFSMKDLLQAKEMNESG